jgi:hypothetical protein
VLFAGDPAGKADLESAGVPVQAYAGGKLLPGQLLVAGPGAGPALAPHAADLAAWLKSGGNVLAVALGQEDIDALLPGKVRVKKGEHIAAYFDPAPTNSVFAGIGPSDVHNRDPRELPLISSGAQILGDGILAKADGANVVFCQIAPWQFGGSPHANLRRTYRRASVLLNSLLANSGAAGPTPLLDRFHNPVAADPAHAEKRWLDGLYLDQPEEWDDPYRFFRW